MLTFHGRQELKDQRIAQVRAHREADQLVKGIYWEKGKGCAVGCTVHGNDHRAYEIELGIPVELAFLEDLIFEELPNGQAMLWPERFLQAIPVGVDLRLSHISKRFVLALLVDEKRGLLSRCSAGSREGLAKIAEIVRRGIAAQTPEEADRADLAYLADRADLAYRADRAYWADLAYLAYLAYRADLAYLAYRADRADRADLAEILLETLAATRPPAGSGLGTGD